MYPSPTRPWFGTFVKRQVETLSLVGCRQDLLIIDGWRSRFEYLKAIFRIRKAIRERHYDLIHAYYGLCGFAAVFQARVPLAVTYCGSDLNPGFAGNCKSPLKSRIIVALGQIAALRATACIVQSREMLRRIFWLGAKERAHVLTCGVDLELFQPGDKAEARVRLGWDLHERVILYVCSDASLPAVKRPELAKAVVSQVNLRLPGTRLQIVSGRPQEALPDYYRGADLLLVTSASEGSPNVVKEALACDLPVISTRAGDIPELLAGLENCRVCNADVTSLASSIEEVLSRGARTHSRERMRTYSMSATSAALLGIYESIYLDNAPTKSVSSEECSHT
jgi:glycosyltransferase involved in cell wall biosynthesis